ncbi:MAG: GH25 family lysozyme, partial [Bacteroidota bacterium]
MRLSILLLVILCCYGCHPPTERMTEYEIHGIDISHYQAQIQWDRIAQQNIHFAFVKASEGESLHDSLYCHNWAELARVGIKRGAYHFFHPSLSIEKQVQNFCEQVDLQAGDLPPVLDV